MAVQQVRTTTNFDTNKDTRKTIPYNQTAIVPGTGNRKAYPYMISSLLTKSKSDWQKGCWPNQGFIEDDYSDVDLSNFNDVVKNFIAIPKLTSGSVTSPFYLFSGYSNVLNNTYQYNNMTNAKDSSSAYRQYGTPWGTPNNNIFNQLIANNDNTYVVKIDNTPYTFDDSTTITSKVVVNNLFGAQTNTAVSIKVADFLDKNAEYLIIKKNNIHFYAGTATQRSISYLQPVQIFEFDGYYVAEVDGSGNYTNRLIEQDGKMYVTFNPYSLLCYYIQGLDSYSYCSYYYQNLTAIDGFFKPDDIIYGYQRSGSVYGYCIIKKDALIRFMNYVGIPWTFDATKAASGSIDNFDDGYNPNQQYIDPYNPPGQPDNESGGGDGLGDNTQDNFEIPTPTINPASAAVNQYVLNSNQVYNFMEELFNGTFWTNSDLLNKNPKESVVSLTAWPINLLNWDLRHVGTSTPIQCGNVTMQYASGQPIQNGYNKVVDIGEYEIKPYFGSFMDYLTKIEIFLPFIGWRNLSTQNVMGRTIKIKYVLNFEDGGIVVYITSTDGTIERLEQVEQAKLAFDLPIFTSNINEKEKDKLQLLMTAAVSAVTAGVGAFGSGAGGVAAAAGTAAGKEVVSGASKIAAWQDHINGGSVVASNATWYLPNKCILKFTRPRKSEPSGYGRVNGYPANYTAKLGDVTGYTEVDNPVINGIECTEIERQKIKTLLQGGIYL